MTDSITMAYINMYAVLGSLEVLCEVSEQARGLLPQQPLSICFKIKDGPALTLHFGDGRCTATPGAGDCDVMLPVSGYEKFNAIVDGNATPIPSKGFSKIKFLTGNFTKLTDLLASYLRATPEALEEETFFNASTTIMFNVIAQALSQIGNHDRIGRFTASGIVDGTLVLGITGGPAASIAVKDHVLTTSRAIPEQPNAVMEFNGMRLARALFDGNVSALACIGTGDIVVRGNLSVIDNINRILDRVALYLA